MTSFVPGHLIGTSKEVQDGGLQRESLLQLPPAGPRFHQLLALQAASAAAKLRETSASEVKTPRRRQPPVAAGSAADQHALLLAGERFEGDCRKGER